jgi:large subunit ribosomal protein L25
MSQTKKLDAQLRERAGKGASRAVRREGLIPAVIYGAKKDPVSISLDSKSVSKLVFAGGFKTTLFDINVGGKAEHVLPREVQFDPVKGYVRHIDFLRVDDKAAIRVDVPVHFLNEDMCPGLKKGGVLNIVEHTVPLFVPAGRIPDNIEVDLANVNIGDTIHVSDLKLPAGAKPAQDESVAVFTMMPPKVTASDAAEDAAAEEADKE